MKTQKALLKDEDGEEEDVYLYRSMIGSLMHLTSSIPDIIFAVIRVNAGDSKLMLLGINLLLLGKVNAVRHNLLLLVLQALVHRKKIVVTEASVRRDLQLEDANGVDCLPNATIFDQLTLIGNVKSQEDLCYTISHKEDFANMRRKGKDFSGRETPLFATMVVQAQEEMSEGSAMPIDPHPTPIITQPSSSQPQRKKKLIRSKEKDTKIPQSSVSSDPINIEDEAVTEEPSMQLKELMDFCTKLKQRVLDLENTKTAQAQEITSLKKRVKRLEKKGGSRTHKLKKLYRVGRSARVVSSKETSLGDQEDASKQGRKIDDIDADVEITLVDESQGRHDDDLFFNTGVLNEEEVFAGQDMAEKKVSTIDPVTTAGEVVATANVEVSSASLTDATITNVELTLAQTLTELKSARPKTKGGVAQDPNRLAKEKAQQVEEANIAWEDIQAKVKADYQLAQRLQAQEQEELSDVEKATLFV
ncbi:hypothetical protein Tco_1366392 [Tanacetum coccineum]